MEKSLQIMLLWMRRWNRRLTLLTRMPVGNADQMKTSMAYCASTFLKKDPYRP